MKKGVITVFAAAFALLVISGGCGGGSDGTSSAASSTSAGTSTSTDSTSTTSTDSTSTTSTESAPSRSEFISQVNAVCKTGKARISSATTKFVKEHKVNTASPTKAENEDLLAEVIAPDLQQQAEEISRLDAPAGDDGKVTALVSAIEDGANQLEQEPASAVKGKNDPLEQAVKLAEEYGIKGCSSK